MFNSGSLVSECGREKSSYTRIVGGDLVPNVGTYPWMTALMYEGKVFCGACLITNEIVITAAHCVDRLE